MNIIIADITNQQIMLSKCVLDSNTNNIMLIILIVVNDDDDDKTTLIISVSITWMEILLFVNIGQHNIQSLVIKLSDCV